MADESNDAGDQVDGREEDERQGEFERDEKAFFFEILKHGLRSFPFPTLFSGRKSPLSGDFYAGADDDGVAKDGGAGLDIGAQLYFAE